LWKWSGQTSV